MIGRNGNNTHSRHSRSAERLDKCELKVCFDNGSVSWKLYAVESVFMQQLLDRSEQQFICPAFHVCEQTEQDGPVFVLALGVDDEEHLVQFTTRLECPVHVKRARFNKPLQIWSQPEYHHLPRVNCFEQYRGEKRIGVINRLDRHRILRPWHVSVYKLSPRGMCPPESHFQSVVVCVSYWFVKAVGAVQFLLERRLLPDRLDLLPARQVGVAPRSRPPQTDATIALALDPRVTALGRASVRFVPLPDVKEVVDDHIDSASARRKCL